MPFENIEIPESVKSLTWSPYVALPELRRKRWGICLIALAHQWWASIGVVVILVLVLVGGCRVENPNGRTFVLQRVLPSLSVVGLVGFAWQWRRAKARVDVEIHRAECGMHREQQLGALEWFAQQGTTAWYMAVGAGWWEDCGVALSPPSGRTEYSDRRPRGLIYFGFTYEVQHRFECTVRTRKSQLFDLVCMTRTSMRGRAEGDATEGVFREWLAKHPDTDAAFREVVECFANAAAAAQVIIDTDEARETARRLVIEEENRLRVLARQEAERQAKIKWDAEAPARAAAEAECRKRAAEQAEVDRAHWSWRVSREQDRLRALKETYQSMGHIGQIDDVNKSLAELNELRELMNRS